MATIEKFKKGDNKMMEGEASDHNERCEKARRVTVRWWRERPVAAMVA